MNPLRARIYFIITKIFLSIVLFGQNIASVQLFNPNSTDFSSFIFEKGTPFTLAFDNLDKQPTNFFYTITHHNANWEKSSLFPSEYLKGNQTVYFNEFKNSFSTNNFYRHYEFSIPNKNTQLLVTGNYIINVYSTKDTQKPIIQRKFCLYQNLNPINLEFFRQVNEENKNQRIQISFKNKKEFINNLNYLKLYIIQNNNFNSIKEYKNPFFMGEQVVFNGNNTVFEGGNEYYFFDTKILNINGFSTYKIEQIDNQTHTFLIPNAINDNKNYIFFNDLNGGFYFRTLNLLTEFDSKVSSDYTYIHFTLDSEKELPYPIHVLGGFNNWEKADQNKMIYNNLKKKYEVILFLKQGYYNYQYVVVYPKEQPNFEMLEGSSYETENDYTIIMYHRPFGARYDRVIGIS
ncbi:MAG: type IX secretion system plug protein domain-containing protein, partial [Solirubrobacteraceae bacterium]